MSPDRFITHTMDRICMSCYDVLAIRDWKNGLCKMCLYKDEREEEMRVPEPMKDPVGYIVCERFTPDVEYFYPDPDGDELIVYPTMHHAFDRVFEKLKDDGELKPTDLCLAVVYRDRGTKLLRIPTIIHESELPKLEPEKEGHPNDYANKEESSQYD